MPRGPVEALVVREQRGAVDALERGRAPEDRAPVGMVAVHAAHEGVHGERERLVLRGCAARSASPAARRRSRRPGSVGRSATSAISSSIFFQFRASAVARSSEKSMSADALDAPAQALGGLGDLEGRAGRGPLEQHLLQQVGDARVVLGLPARAAPHEQRGARRPGSAVFSRTSTVRPLGSCSRRGPWAAATPTRPTRPPRRARAVETTRERRSRRSGPAARRRAARSASGSGSGGRPPGLCAASPCARGPRRRARPPGSRWSRRGRTRGRGPRRSRVENSCSASERGDGPRQLVRR